MSISQSSCHSKSFTRFEARWRYVSPIQKYLLLIFKKCISEHKNDFEKTYSNSRSSHSFFLLPINDELNILIFD